MANFLLVYTGGSGAAPTPEESAAIMENWTNWFTSLGENVITPAIQRRRWQSVSPATAR